MAELEFLPVLLSSVTVQLTGRTLQHAVQHAVQQCPDPQMRCREREAQSDHLYLCLPPSAIVHVKTTHLGQGKQWDAIMAGLQ